MQRRDPEKVIVHWLLVYRIGSWDRVLAIQGDTMFKIESSRLFSKENAAEKREELLSFILDSLKQVQETEAGYHLRFGQSNEELVIISDWLQTERIANPFLRFNLAIESHDGPISLDISGPEGTKSFLESALSLNRWL